MYRKAENPHKKVYDRKQSMRRLRKNAPNTIRSLRSEIGWLSRIADNRADSMDELNVRLRVMKTGLKGLLGILAACVLGIGVLWVRGSDLADENAELRHDLHTFDVENRHLASEYNATRDELLSELEHSSILNGRLGTCHRDLRASQSTLHETMSRVDELMSMANDAIARVQLNDLRIEILERDCGLR